MEGRPGPASGGQACCGCKAGPLWKEGLLVKVGVEVEVEVEAVYPTGAVGELL